jgi:hypothetical protein
MKTDELIGLLARDIGTALPVPATSLSRWLPLAALAAGAIFLAVLGMRPNIGSATTMFPTGLKLGFGLVLAAAAGVVAMRLARPDADRLNAVMLLAFMAALMAVVLAAGGFLSNAPRANWTTILKCVTMIPLMSLLPLAAFLMALRQGAVTQPEIAGAMSGLASGGLAILAYGLHCTEDSPLFIGLWYSVAALCAAGIGAVAGRRVLAW